MKFCVINFIFFIIINHVDCKRYTNYTLFRSVPITTQQLEFLRTIGSTYKVNYWREPGLLNKTVDFLVAPEDKNILLKDAEDNLVDLTTIMDDVQQAFDKQTVASYIRRRLTSFDWGNYYRLGDIYVWLKDLAAAHPDDVVVQSIGTTYENRQILMCKINLRGTLKRSTVFIEGGIHAREWVSAAFVTYFIHQIVNSGSSKNPLLKRIGETYEFIFIPVANPDGYEYTHTKDRLWRKNRSYGNGVDLNRNFGIAFGTVGVSFDKKDEIYCGDKAFSERETQAIANILRNHGHRVEYYLAFHSYGQFMILPYAHMTRHTENYDEVAGVCKEAKEKIRARYGTVYAVGTAYDTVGYATSGVSGCWAKAFFRIPYVVTFELRDTGQHGFALPPDQIMATCMETMDGVLSILTPKGASMKKLPTKFTELSVSKAPNLLIDVPSKFNIILAITAMTIMPWDVYFLDYK